MAWWAACRDKRRGHVPRAGGGSGGVTGNVQNRTWVAANATAHVQRGPDGHQMVNLVLQAVRKDFATGDFDGVAKGRYRLSTAPVQRRVTLTWC